jgi:hypothetical protein
MCDLTDEVVPKQDFFLVQGFSVVNSYCTSARYSSVYERRMNSMPVRGRTLTETVSLSHENKEPANDMTLDKPRNEELRVLNYFTQILL